ncbi:MAG: hypothetical protein U1F34_03400 [Gammaproteobacteria bacterium]
MSIVTKLLNCGDYSYQRSFGAKPEPGPARTVVDGHRSYACLPAEHPFDQPQTCRAARTLEDECDLAVSIIVRYLKLLPKARMIQRLHPQLHRRGEIFNTRRSTRSMLVEIAETRLFDKVGSRGASGTAHRPLNPGNRNAQHHVCWDWFAAMEAVHRESGCARQLIEIGMPDRVGNQSFGTGVSHRVHRQGADAGILTGRSNSMRNRLRSRIIEISRKSCGNRLSQRDFFPDR